MDDENYDIKKFRDIILGERQKFENPIDYAEVMYDKQSWDEIEAEYYAVHRKG